jgi:Domain of unknown function (DUF4398)
MLALTRRIAGLVRSVIGALVAALAAGCIALPADQGALDRARAALEQARSAPRVRALAPAELDLAEVALQQAEAAARAGAPSSHVEHLAYVASRQAALAEAHALGRVAQAEARALQRALGPTVVNAYASPVGEQPAADGVFAAGNDAGQELVLSPSELAFDDAEPSPETDRELGQIVERLLLEPTSAVSIEADFDLPDPAARTAMERRIELIRATLLRRGIEPSRIIVRASAPREEPAAASSRPAGALSPE